MCAAVRQNWVTGRWRKREGDRNDRREGKKLKKILTASESTEWTSCVCLHHPAKKKTTLQWPASSVWLQVSWFHCVQSSLQSACNAMWLKHDSGEWNLRAGTAEDNSFTTQTSQLIIRKLPCHISFCLPMSSSPLLPVMLAAGTLSVRLSLLPPGFYSLRSPVVAEIVGLTDRDILQNGCHCTGLWATSKVDYNPFSMKDTGWFYAVERQLEP